MEATATIKMELSPEVLSTFEHLTRALDEHSNLLRIEQKMRPDPSSPLYDDVLKNLGSHRCRHVVEPVRPNTLLEDLQHLINRHSRENASDTPDYVLAEYLLNCLCAFEAATRTRDGWYSNAEHEIGL